MSDEHYGQIQLAVDVADQPQDAAGRLRIQGAGRLIAQQHLGIIGQSPGNGHALLLSAGKLRWIDIRFVAQVDERQQILHLRADLRLAQAALMQRKSYVLRHRA